MPANPVREKRDLLFIFGLPNPSELLVRVAISGEVQVIAQGPNPLDRTTVLLQPPDGGIFNSRTYNLLEFAPIEWWRPSTTLLRAVENGWLYVDVADVQPAQQQAAITEPDCCELAVLKPPNPLIGDLLVWNGTEWTTLNPGGTAGNVLTSNGPLLLPSYQPVVVPATGAAYLPITLDQSTDQGSFDMVGGFSLNAADYSQVQFVTLGVVTSNTLAGEIRLYNLTDAAIVVTHTYTSTNPTKIVSAPLVLPVGEKVYEIRIRVTGGVPPADRVFCTWGGLLLTE
jgi:hypothetical protein